MKKTKQSNILTLVNHAFNKRSAILICVLSITIWLMFSPFKPTNAIKALDLTDFDGTLRRIHVPVLMYHYVSELPEDADEFRRDLTITPSQFREHMQYLIENGYETISLYDLDNALNYGLPLPDGAIILTFDDGYIDHYTDALPILTEFGFTGTFFVITDRLDNGDHEYINWQQAQTMETAGMSIESHTKSHPDLRNRDYEFLIYQILGSIQSIEAHTQETAQMFSYPSGRYDENTLAVLDTMPISRAVTTENGAWHTTDNRLQMMRLRISGDMSVVGLHQLLTSSLNP